MNSIMIVDDSEELRSLFCRAFERELGARCLKLKSLSEVKQNEKDVLSCDIAILDINLGPGEPDGVEIHDWLRSQTYQGNIFFITGHAADSPAVKRAAETNVPILEKPMSPRQLISTIKESMSARP